MRRVLSVAVVAAIAPLVVVPGAVGWSWPVEGPLLRPFSLAADEYAAGQHRGVDIGAAAGDPVRAPAAGVVSFVGPVPAGGRALTIQTADGYAVTLLQLGSVAVTRGSAVGEGGIVGQVGDSEDAVTAVPHVHLGVRVATEPNGYVDPLGLLPAVAPPDPVAPVTAPAPGRDPVPAPTVEPAAPAESTPAVGPVDTPSLVSGPAPEVTPAAVVRSSPCRGARPDRAHRSRRTPGSPAQGRSCSRPPPDERRRCACARPLSARHAVQRLRPARAGFSGRR